MVVKGFRVFTCDTVTGQNVRDLPVSKSSWGVRLNDGGSIGATIQQTALETASLDIRSVTTPVLQCLGVSYNGRILECGPIWGRDYPPDGAERLVLSAAGLWSLFDSRKALPGAYLHPDANPAEAVLALSGLSLGSIGRELVRISIEDNPYGLGGLNIVLPAAVGGTHQRTYEGYDLAWIGTRLRELTEVPDGPDIRFRPRFTGPDETRVEWVYEHGSEEQPLLQQAGQDWFWDAGVPDSPAVRVGVKQDASKMAARAWVPGNGQEKAMKVATATDLQMVNAGWPWLEADDARKDTDNDGLLQDYADRLLADVTFPWDQWTLAVRADQSPLLGEYLPGEWAQVNIGPGHNVLGPGQRRVRIMAIDGDETEVVQITVAPIQGSADSGWGASGTVGGGLSTPPPTSSSTPYPSPDTYPSPDLYPGV